MRFKRIINVLKKINKERENHHMNIMIVTSDKMKRENYLSYKDFVRDKNNKLVHKSQLTNQTKKESVN